MNKTTILFFLIITATFGCNSSQVDVTGKEDTTNTEKYELFFSAMREPWKYKVYHYSGSGVMVSTPVIDLNPGANDDVGDLVVFNNKLYFAGLVDGVGSKLFEYNGVSAVSRSNIFPGSTDYPFGMFGMGDELVFVSAITGEMYSYKGSSVGSIPETNVEGADIDYNPQSKDWSLYNNNLYYISRLDNSKKKIFKYDGASTTQVSNSYPAGNDRPSELTVFNGKLYFISYDISGSRFLYAYDGISVSPVTDPLLFSEPQRLYVHKNELFLSAYNVAGYTKLFKYTGSAFSQVSDINAGSDDSIYSFASLKNDLIFSSDSGSSIELFKYNHTNGVVRVPVSNPVGEGDPRKLTVIGDKLYFYYYKSDECRGLYKYDGSTVELVTGNTVCAPNTDLEQIAGYSSDVYFVSANPPDSFRKLYHYDGSTVRQISDTNPGGSDIDTKSRLVLIKK